MTSPKSRLVSATLENRGKGASHIAFECQKGRDQKGRLILKEHLFDARRHYLAPEARYKGQPTLRTISDSDIPLNWVRIPDQAAQDFLDEQNAIINAAYLRKAEYLQEHFREWSLAEVSDFPPKEHEEAEAADKKLLTGDFKRMFG